MERRGGVAKAGVRLSPGSSSEMPRNSGERGDGGVGMKWSWGDRGGKHQGQGWSTGDTGFAGGRSVLKVCKMFISFQTLPPSPERAVKGLVATWRVILRGAGGQGRGMPGQEQLRHHPKRQQGDPLEDNGADGGRAAVCRQVERVRWGCRSDPRKKGNSWKGR